MVTVSIDFSGGLELLFGNVKSFARVAIDSDNGTDVVTMRIALAWMKDHMLKERPELFLHGESIRPGILCLINDTDWELEGTLDYCLQPGDNLAFISTLHGG